MPWPITLDLQCKHSIGRGDRRDGQPRTLGLKLAQQVASPVHLHSFDSPTCSPRTDCSCGNALACLCELTVRILVRPAQLLQLALDTLPAAALLAYQLEGCIHAGFVRGPTFYSVDSSRARQDQGSRPSHQRKHYRGTSIHYRSAFARGHHHELAPARRRRAHSTLYRYSFTSEPSGLPVFRHPEFSLRNSS